MKFQSKNLKVNNTPQIFDNSEIYIYQHFFLWQFPARNNDLRPETSEAYVWTRRTAMIDLRPTVILLSLRRTSFGKEHCGIMECDCIV